MVELIGITKAFDGVVANDNITLTAKPGEVLALLGENGSGKTTLMNILYGIYAPDAGTIKINNEEVQINSPSDAMKLGIGMVHQHFKLVDIFSAEENIMLSAKRGVAQRMNKKYGFGIDLTKKVYNMSVGERQMLEILKVLCNGANIIILDEPTAVLTPQESENLFNVMRVLRDSGKTLIFISHKLNEVLEISRWIHVLRKGKDAGVVENCYATPQYLTELMVGRKVDLKIERPPPATSATKLEIRQLSCAAPENPNALVNVNFTLTGGEILGVAGVAGSGQKYLCEVLAGLRFATGSIQCNGQELNGKTPKEIRKAGVNVAFVPEDRLGMGLVADMDIVENIAIRTYEVGNTPFVNRIWAQTGAEIIVNKLSVVQPGLNKPIRLLSGGNIQKILLGREINSSPMVLIAGYPTRGLDIGASYAIYDLLNEQKKKGVAVLYIGEDLDVLLELCDRIIVMCGGTVAAHRYATQTTKEELGHFMTGGVE